MATYKRILPDAARTAFTSSPIFISEDKFTAMHLVVDITDGSNLSVAIKGMDGVSSKSYTILSSVLASGTTVMRVGPDYTAGANIAKDYIPYKWFVDINPSGSTTVSVGASLI